MFDNFYILFLCTANTAATAAAEILASHSSAATAGAVEAEDTALEVATRVSFFVVVIPVVVVCKNGCSILPIL